MGVYIPIKDYSAMQGPAPDGFHVPLTTERQTVYDIRTTLGGGSTDGTNFGIALKLPFAGYRNSPAAGVNNKGSLGRYWSSSRSSTSSAYYLRIYSSGIEPQSTSVRANGLSLRCFKNSPTIPTSSWTKLYGTSIEAGGIFWSSTDGLISLSSNGQTWITISDKNLGATTAWNSGDTLSETNCGGYFQWGNNYMFPFTGTVTTSSTKVDASNYGPGNYYSSSTFITGSGAWDSTDNGNLRGGVTGVKFIMTELKNAYIGEYRVGNTYPGAIEKTSDMVYDIDFSGGNIVDKCGLSITNSGVTTMNDANNYVGVLNGSSQINLNSTAVYSPSTAMFYSMWIKISSTSGRVLDLHNGYSEMLIGFGSTIPNGYSYGREEANRGGSGIRQQSGFNINDWHLVQMRYDGSSTTYLYVDGEYKTSVSNTYSGYGSTGTGQMIGSSNGSNYVVGYVGQCYARTTRPSDSEILEEYNYTRPR